MNLKNKIFRHFICILIICLIICSPASAIKIGLLDCVDQNYIAVSHPGLILNGTTGSKIMDLPHMKKYNLKKYGNSIGILLNGSFYDLKTNYLIVRTDLSGYVSTKNKWYRGDLVVINNKKGLTFINNVSLESYLLGVVPTEMPSSWNIEAHKAQAIAARSYAIANKGKRLKSGYDLKDTPEDQAYGGASGETIKTSHAVLNTKGQVLVHNNKIISAYYHASAGGYTLNSGEVWHKNLPFIKSVPSFDNQIPKSGHGVGMSQYGANMLADYGYNAYQILNYFYKDIVFKTVNTNHLLKNN